MSAPRSADDHLKLTSSLILSICGFLSQNAITNLKQYEVPTGRMIREKRIGDTPMRADEHNDDKCNWSGATGGGNGTQRTPGTWKRLETFSKHFRHRILWGKGLRFFVDSQDVGPRIMIKTRLGTPVVGRGTDYIGLVFGTVAQTTPRRGVVYSLCEKRGIPGGQPVCRARRTPLS